MKRQSVARMRRRFRHMHNLGIAGEVDPTTLEFLDRPRAVGRYLVPTVSFSIRPKD